MLTAAVEQQVDPSGTELECRVPSRVTTLATGKDGLLVLNILNVIDF